jgi:maleamate amidohydrolase
MKDLVKDYEGAGFGQSMGFGQRPALVLVDFVGAYFLPQSPLYAADVCVVMTEALQSALRLREAAHIADIPVVLTKVELTPLEIRKNLMFRKTSGTGLFEKGSPLADFIPPLEPQSGEIFINKHYASGFFNTPLAEVLAFHRVDSVILTGLSTSGCVRATCSDSLSYGFAPFVVREAVADRDPRPHEANLFDMGQKYADIVSEAETLAYLARIGAEGRATLAGER